MIDLLRGLVPAHDATLVELAVWWATTGALGLFTVFCLLVVVPEIADAFGETDDDDDGPDDVLPL